MACETSRETLDQFEHDLELELDGAVEVRPGVLAAGGALLTVAVVLTALNLRPAITSIGPLLGEMRGALGASAVWAGVLTTLPGLCFAGAGLAAPWLARRFGLGRAISLALVVLTAGLLVRVLDGPAVMIGGTLVAAAGIALINVLIPVVIKGSFPAQVGLMTGVYTAAGRRRRGLRRHAHAGRGIRRLAIRVGRLGSAGCAGVGGVAAGGGEPRQGVVR